jgi:GDP-L-fucose synthase
VFQDKNVLVTGATGMIGRELVLLLRELGANVTATSFDNFNVSEDSNFNGIKFVFGDLRDPNFCSKITKEMEFVFHVAGIKGSPKMALERPSTFFVNTALFNLNLIEASRISGVKHLLYTSSIGVYAPSEIFHEESVWKTFPSENDRFAGWAKRMGELHLEANKIEYGWDSTYIVRPANVYGNWDNFDPETAMVIPSLIARISAGENPLRVWGDGSAIRDFVHAHDVARAMIFVVENGINEVVNIGSGIGVSIREIAESLARINKGLEIVWDTDKPQGDLKRILDMSKLEKYGFKNTVSLDEGLRKVSNWFNQQDNTRSEKYNAFKEIR